MAKLTNIDRTRKVTFTPHTTSDNRPDGFPDWLPPRFFHGVEEETVEITPPCNGQRHILDWLAESGWAVEVERDLQGLSQTAAGEPLLSSFLELNDFATLATDATIAGMLPSMDDAIERWHKLGVTHVVFDGYEVAGNRQQAS